MRIEELSWLFRSGSSDADARARVDRVFDGARTDSPWSRALGRLGLRAPAGTRWLSWGTDGEAAWNLDAMKAMIAGTGLWRAMRLQWRIERWIAEIGARRAPSAEEALVDSLTLGLCVVALTLRLPRGTDLAAGFAAPEQAPRAARTTLERILRVQSMRGRLSWAWESVIPNPDAESEITTPPPSTRESDSGTPIFPGEVSGTLIHAVPGRTEERERIAQIPAPRILVFARPTPATIELLDLAAGVVFQQGNLLAHACIVARESRLPSALDLSIPPESENRTIHLTVTPTMTRVTYEKVRSTF